MKKRAWLLRCFIYSMMGLLGSIAACGDGGGSTQGSIPAPPAASAPSPPASSPSTVVARAGADQTVEQVVLVTLDGSGSSTSGTAPLMYSWRQTGGPAVVLSGASSARPTFVAPHAEAETVLRFALTVSAGVTSSASTVSVVVLRDSPWGVAPSSTLTRDPNSWLPAMAQANVTTVRNFDSNPLEDHLKPLLDAGMSVTGILYWSPTATRTLPVSDLAGWRQYVAAKVSEYKGRVKYWEVWNEPPNFTEDKSPASYGRVVAAAYDAAKAVDPTVQIGLTAKSNHVNWLAQSIEGGAAGKFDFVTLHPYENTYLLMQGWEGQFMSIVPRVRTMLRDKDPGRANVPVWFTEIGIQASPPAALGATLPVQADTLVKIYAMGIQQGVARIYWFDPRDSEGLNFGLTARDSTRRPAYFALQAMSRYLGPRPKPLGWTQANGDYHGFLFEGPLGTVLTAWPQPGRVHTLSFVSPVSVVDPRTGALSAARTTNLQDSPVLLVAPTDSSQASLWRQEAVANSGRHYVWGADRSNRQTVSLTAGSEPDGLFMVDAPPPTLANGVSEFNMSGRGGARFTVDPAFLSYLTVPVRITATLRAVGAGEPGFNLKYESNALFSLADGNGLVTVSEGWHRVRDTNLYEKSWDLPNPRFVGLYGYNFVFDTDGATHSQFSIHSVTLTKQ